MASGVVTANIVAQTVFTAPLNKKVHITGIEVDNRSAGGVTLSLQDVFTTTATTAAVAAAITAVRKRFSVGAGTTFEWSDETKSIEIFGACSILSSATQANCDITILWSDEK